MTDVETLILVLIWTAALLGAAVLCLVVKDWAISVWSRFSDWSSAKKVEPKSSERVTVDINTVDLEAWAKDSEYRTIWMNAAMELHPVEKVANAVVLANRASGRYKPMSDLEANRYADKVIAAMALAKGELKGFTEDTDTDAE